MLDSKANKLVFWGYKEDLKGYKLQGTEKQGVCLEQTITLVEASMVKPTFPQQVETMKTKLVLSQREESNATPRCLVRSISSGISSVVISGEDQVVDMNIEHVGKIVSVAARGTKGNPGK